MRLLEILQVVCHSLYKGAVLLFAKKTEEKHEHFRTVKPLKILRQQLLIFCRSLAAYIASRLIWCKSLINFLWQNQVFDTVFGMDLSVLYLMFVAVRIRSLNCLLVRRILGLHLTFFIKLYICSQRQVLSTADDLAKMFSDSYRLTQCCSKCTRAL